MIRLSDEPGSASVYFHQNPYTPDGQKLIITTPDGLASINLKTRAIEKVVAGRVGVIIVGRKSWSVWIYLFRPELVSDRTDGELPNAKDLVRPSVFKAERLVNLAKHDYNLEPNVTFTPDVKWIVFRSNMFGPTHVFAVEIAKAKQ